MSAPTTFAFPRRERAKTRRAATGVVSTAIVVVLLGGCSSSGEQTTTRATESEAPAPSAADRRAATRAWRRLVQKKAGRIVKAQYSTPGEGVPRERLTVTVGARPLRWRNCVHTGAFCAVGSVRVVYRSTPQVTTRSFWSLSGKVEKVGDRWVAFERVGDRWVD